MNISKISSLPSSSLRFLPRSSSSPTKKKPDDQKGRALESVFTTSPELLRRGIEVLKSNLSGQTRLSGRRTFAFMMGITLELISKTGVCAHNPQGEVNVFLRPTTENTTGITTENITGITTPIDDKADHNDITASLKLTMYILLVLAIFFYGLVVIISIYNKMTEGKYLPHLSQLCPSRSDNKILNSTRDNFSKENPAFTKSDSNYENSV